MVVFLLQLLAILHARLGFQGFREQLAHPALQWSSCSFYRRLGPLLCVVRRRWAPTGQWREGEVVHRRRNVHGRGPSVLKLGAVADKLQTAHNGSQALQWSWRSPR